MATDMQFRHGTAAAFTSSNRILAKGEPGFETDTGKLKVGDGTTHWTGLGYVTDQTQLAVGTTPGTVAAGDDPRILAAAPVTSTTAALNAVGNAINTALKVIGKPVLNTDTHIVVFASGTTAGAHWYTGAGVDTNTPV